jgi:hypothetical protein
MVDTHDIFGGIVFVFGDMHGNISCVLFYCLFGRNGMYVLGFRFWY